MKKAVIFDMDGVISDTQKFHAQVESQLLAEFGIKMSPDEITQDYAGVPDEQMFEDLLSRSDVKNYIIKDLVEKKWELMRQATNGSVTAIPYSLELINILKENSFLLAIASSSTKSFIEIVVMDLHIEEKFDIIVSGQEVKYGKPNPDIFLLAAKKLAVLSQECVVIEDGRSGMVAAKAAGMKCIGLVTNVKEKWPADCLVTSLSQINLKLLEEL